MSNLVVITDCDFGDGGIEAKELSRHGFDLQIECVPPIEDEVIRVAQGAVGLLVQYAPITHAVLKELPSLKVVVRYGVGLDNIDLAAAERAGVHVRGVTGYCTDEVADHCVALLLTATRSIRQADSSIKQGGWPRPQQLDNLLTLRDLTVGLVGFGQIACAVATRLKAFGARVLAHDPYADERTFEEHGVTKSSLAEVLGCDAVSLHMPAVPDQAPIISREALLAMKPGVVLVNVSRGALVDESALMEALDSGHVSLAGLDVFCHEAAGKSELALHPRVVASPHVAYFSPKSLDALRRIAAETIVAELRRAS